MMDKRSETNLVGVRAALVNVVRRAHEIVEDDHEGLSFIVIEGLRTIERQAMLVKTGASKTMNSYHLDGRAVDLMAVVYGEARWDWALYPKLANAMKQAAKELGVVITWGGDWPKFKDGCHFQLEEGAQA